MAGESIMVVEDDIISAEALCVKLSDFGYTILPFKDNGKDAVRAAAELFPNLVLMDIKLSGSMDGIAAAAAIKKHMDIPVIYLTAYTDDEILQRARITAPYSYLVKPIRDKELQITIDMVLYRHRLEARLKERERWLDTVLRSIGDAVVATDDSGRINFMNPVAEGLSAWKLKRALGKPLHEVLRLVNEKSGEAAENPVSRVLKEGKMVGLANHTILIAKDGTQHFIDDSASPVLDANGRLSGVVMVFRDVTRRREIERDLDHHRRNLEDLVADRTTVLQKEITDRKNAESRLRKEAEFRRTIIDNIAEGLCVWEKIPHWPFVRFSVWNDRMTEITGYTMSEINEKGWFDSLYPDRAKRDEARANTELALAGDPAKSDEREITCADGRTRTLLISASIIQGRGNKPQVLSLMRDITQRKRAEQERDKLKLQLIQAQKMESIGTLAGGIAHDFNNILAAIIGYGELIEMFEIPDNSHILKNIEQVLKSAYRARDLVDQILTLSRQSDVEKQPLLLIPIVKETVKFLRASLPSTIEIKRNIEGISGTILANATQMHQVVMNLCTNAAQAMGDQGGILKISVKSVYLDEESAAHFEQLSPGTYVKLSISDTGDGIPEKIQNKIFEPYFTTKEIGEGTGLGLAVTHGIIQQHHGEITFESRPHQGTTFHVMLPLDASVHEDTIEGIESPAKHGKGRVLLVDDEPALAEFEKEALSHLGYHVDAETDSRHTLTRFEDNPDTYDIIISDQTMPFMTGLELAKKIKAVRSDIPIILCTGFSTSITPERLTDIGIDLLIRKPITIRQLSDAVFRLLKQ